MPLSAPRQQRSSTGATRFTAAPLICWPSEEPAVAAEAVVSDREPLKSSPDRLMTPSCSRRLVPSSRAEETRTVLALASDVSSGSIGLACSTWL